MRLLLDTHALLWWLAGNTRIPLGTRDVIDASHVFVSAATAWEISTKHRLGKLPLSGEIAGDYLGALRRQSFQPLDVTTDHAWRAGRLPGTHRDPFDRLLIAQAQAENLAVVSADAVFDAYGVRRIW